METQNLVISFDYSWFLAKKLAYAECRIMKFHYRNSSTLRTIDPISFFLSIRQKWKMSRNFSNLLVNGGQFQSPKGCLWKSMIFYKTTKIFPSYFNNLIYDNHTIAVQKQNVRLFFKCCRSVNFEMSFWCHRFDQNSNKNIVIFCTYLASCGASWGLPGGFLGASIF